MSIHYLRLGLLVFLSSIPQSTSAQVAVQHVTVNGKVLPYQPNQPIRLTALANDVTFTFSSQPGQRSIYQYRLDGFDEHWILSPYPMARYTNLDGKDYVLAVRRILNRQVVGHIRIPVSIERELTEEWWFIPAVIVYVLMLLGALMYFFILYTFRQKLKVQSLRYRIAADLHDEVGATLSSIAMATTMVQRKVSGNQPDVQSLLAHIKTDSEETIHTIRDTVWTINPDNDSPEKLFEKMRSLAFQMLTVQNVALQFDNLVPVNKTLKINIEQRRNLYLIFKEAMNNIAKHSAATKAHVQITRSAQGLHVLIEDNGVGFNTNQQTDGNGLRNFRSRAADSFIDLIIDSAPGRGTRLLLVVPEL